MNEMAEDSKTPQRITYWDRILAIVAIIAIIVTILISPGLFTLGSTLVGLPLFATLLATDKEDESKWDCYSFGTAYAFCCILIFGFLLINPLTLLLAPWLTGVITPWMQHFVNIGGIGNIEAVKEQYNPQAIVFSQVSDGIVFFVAIALAWIVARWRLWVFRNKSKPPRLPRFLATLIWKDPPWLSNTSISLTGQQPSVAQTPFNVRDEEA